MACGERFKENNDRRILSNDDILDLVYLKRTNLEDYKQTIRDISEILLDIEEIKKEVYAKQKRYTLNFQLLKKVREKGFCLCEVEKKEDGSNTCPCNNFLDKGECKCGVFKK